MRGRLTSKISNIVAAAVVAITPVLAVPATTFAAADVCTWTGAANANWNNASNWTGCDNGNLPETGDALIFPASASNKTMNNDFVSLQASSLTFNGTGYTINGNGFTVGNAITVNESATINANMSLGLGASHFTFYPLVNKTLTLNGVSAFNLTGFYEVNIGSPIYKGTVDFVGNITGTATGQFVAVNEAKAIVRGASNTFTSNFVGAETNATFECRSASCFGNNANVIYSGGGIVDIYSAGTYAHSVATSTTTPEDSWLRAYDDAIITGAVTVNDGLGLVQETANKGLQFTNSMTLNGPLSVFGSASGANVQLSGAIGGIGGISYGAGAAIVSGNNTYTGLTTINPNTVVAVSQSNAFGASSSGTTVLDGGSVVFGSPNPLTLAEPFTIKGNGAGSGVTAALYSESLDDVTLSGTITLAGDASIETSTTDSNIDLTGVVSGTGNLALRGKYDSFSSGSISLSGGAPNTFNGDVIMKGGVVYAEKAGAIPHNVTFATTDPTTNRSIFYLYGSNDVMSDTGVVTLSDQDDTFKFGNTGTETIGGLVGSHGRVEFQNTGSNAIINQNFDSTFGGSFYSDGETVSLTKRGTGTLNLTGNATFAGDVITFIAEGGVLSINGNVKTNTGGNVVVNPGGTLKGTGATRSVSVAGGIIAPGNSPGTLTATDLTLDTNSIYQQEIAGPTAGSQYDQLVASGAVNLGNATLSVAPSYTPAPGTVFTIIRGVSVTGTFKGLADGSMVVAGGLTLRINYTPTTVTLTYVNGTSTTSSAVPGAPNTGAQRIAHGMWPFIVGILLVVGVGYRLRGTIATRLRALRR